MDPFARRRLGLTAVEVTQLGFGGAGLGDLFEVIPEAQAAATLEAAWDAGIRYYDTAPGYGLTQSEHRFGRALYRQPRRDFVLSTKVGRTMHAVHHAETYDRGIWTGGLPFQVRFDYSYDGVMRSFEDSLQRLGLPRIDLLVIHDLDIQYHQTYKRVEALLMSESGARHLPRIEPLLPPRLAIFRTSDKLFESIADTRTPQGIAALVEPRQAAIETLSAGVPLLAVLAGVQDPGNVGTIARAAEAFGADVVRRYATMARVELEAYHSAVTDWELRRYFERI